MRISTAMYIFRGGSEKYQRKIIRHEYICWEYLSRLARQNKPQCEEKSSLCRAVSPTSTFALYILLYSILSEIFLSWKQLRQTLINIENDKMLWGENILIAFCSRLNIRFADCQSIAMAFSPMVNKYVFMCVHTFEHHYHRINNLLLFSIDLPIIEGVTTVTSNNVAHFELATRE